MEPSPVVEPERPVAFAPVYLSHLRDVRAVERATIPVEKTRGPILLVSGLTIRCGHRRRSPTSQCAGLRRIVTPIRSGI
jgi:hypothetical protein